MEKGIEILLINNNIKEQAIFSFALNNLQLNYTCHFADDVTTAMKMLSSFIPDYIFIDVQELKLNKLINLRKLKKTNPVKKTAVIVYADDELAVNQNITGLRYGAYMCIQKTKVIAELVHGLRSVFIPR